MSGYDLLIRGGHIVTESSQYRADVCIKDGHIAALILNQDVKANQIIDANEKLVLPGVIDAHVHMQIMQQDKYATADDFESGTRAAAAGGVTTIIDFFTPAGNESLQETFHSRRKLADPQVLIDYGLHCTVSKDSDLEGEIDFLIDAGITSFKLFQVYGRLALSDAELFRNLELIGRKGALATLHAENGQVAELLIDRLRQQGKTRAIDHAYSRPPFVEVACIETAINFARVCGTYLYIVHTSTGDGLDVIKAAKKAGQVVLSETCPQYLLLSEEDLAGEDGNLYLCTPPLRKKTDQASLWRGLAEGSIQTLATDHCCFYRRQKIEAPSFYQAPGGIGSVELLLPLIYSEGVCKGRLQASQMVRALCYHPAAIFGLLPHKGQIAPGADADLVIFDPNICWQVDSSQLHSKDDYSVYQGFSLQGKVDCTLSRGEIIYQDGKIIGRAGRGRFLKRNLPDKEKLAGIF
jgi:dihydropyrimidinase